MGAVRRAFLASVATHSKSARGDRVAGPAHPWTMEDVGVWLDKTLPTAFEHDDRVVGARTLWYAWGSVEQVFTDELRRSTIKLMDNKLQTVGFSSLRELVRLQDGG